MPADIWLSAGEALIKHTKSKSDDKLRSGYFKSNQTQTYCASSTTTDAAWI